MKRILPRNLAWILLLVGLTQAGCGTSEPPPMPGDEKKVDFIGISLANLDGPRRMQIEADIKDAAAKHPELHYVIQDAQNDSAKQREQIEVYIAAGAKLLIVSPKDTQPLTEPVAKAFDAGIPVIVLNRSLIGGKFTCFIAADYRQIGAEAGKYLAWRLQGKGKIVELRGPVDSLHAQDMHDAFRAALKDPGYRFVYTGFLDPSKADAAKLADEALHQAKQIDALFAFDDATAFAAYQIFKAAGREKGVAFIGVGGLSSEGADYVKKHILSATITHSTGGAEAVDAVVKILTGRNVPKEIVLPVSSFGEEDIPYLQSGHSKNDR